MSSDLPTRQDRPIRLVVALACLLTVLAILDVALAFAHRESIVVMWQNLKRRSYPPYEAYETLPIDMEAGFGFLGFSCAWVVFQLSSLVLYLCFCRRTSLGANLAFSVLWLLSLVGAVAYHVVIRRAGWGAEVLDH